VALLLCTMPVTQVECREAVLGTQHFQAG
jgi:hypothetical protein